MVKAIIDGKRFDSNKGWEILYEDGRFKGSRGVNYYIKKVKNEIRCVIEYWTRWQGESDSYEYLTDLNEIIERLQHQAHPDRVNASIEQLEELAGQPIVEEL